QDLAEPFPPDPHLPDLVVGQVAGEFAHAPVSERATHLRRAGGGRQAMNSSSSPLIRRGRPPAHLGSSAVRPLSLNAWITSRTVSSSAATSRAIAAAVVSDDDAMMIIARRTRIDPCLPRRTICCNR